MIFSTCEICRRHVQRGEACPFCARRGRGRVLAGMLTVGLAACGPPPVAAVYGGPPEPEPDAAVPDTAPDTAPETAAPATTPPAPIYGGPPSVLQAPETQGETP